MKAFNILVSPVTTRTEKIESGAYPEGKILLSLEKIHTNGTSEEVVDNLRSCGYEAVISSHIGESFRNAAYEKGLLPVQVTEEFVENLSGENGTGSPEVMIDLEKQLITNKTNGEWGCFSINAHRKYCFLQGLAYSDKMQPSLDDIHTFYLLRG